MKSYFAIVFVAVAGLFACSMDSPLDPLSKATFFETKSRANTPIENASNSFRAGIIDDFDDGLISDIWIPFATGDGSVVEADGVLRLQVSDTVRTDGDPHQTSGIRSRDFILQGNFDIQVDFRLCDDYFTFSENVNTKLFLIDREGDAIEISIRNWFFNGVNYGVYSSGEVVKPGGSAEIEPLQSSSTEQLVGKLRITRSGHHITTYYWESGWIRHSRWKAQITSGDLMINIDSWNRTPDYIGFSTVFDNVIASSPSSVEHSGGFAYGRQHFR
jgi:hypothetical protein